MLARVISSPLSGLNGSALGRPSLQFGLLVATSSGPGVWRDNQLNRLAFHVGWQLAGLGTRDIVHVSFAANFCSCASPPGENKKISTMTLAPIPKLTDPALSVQHSLSVPLFPRA